ncbi:MAG TPA: nitroreductase [Fimbriimonadaceae bacterium]|nr:nitroreductase [Fimbriimonadaceae bacterium]
MVVSKAIYNRRAIRNYTDEPVPEAVVRKLIDAAIQAPSAMNHQPWAFVVVQDKGLLKEVSDRAKSLLADAEPFAHFPSVPHQGEAHEEFNVFYNAGTLIVICAGEGAPHPDWDCCLAGMNLMLEAEELGYGTCVIGLAWGALESEEVREKLGIPAEYKPILPIIVGRPREEPPSHGRNAPRILKWVTALTASR